MVAFIWEHLFWMCSFSGELSLLTRLYLKPLSMAYLELELLQSQLPVSDFDGWVGSVKWQDRGRDLDLYLELRVWIFPGGQTRTSEGASLFKPSPAGGCPSLLPGGQVWGRHCQAAGLEWVPTRVLCPICAKNGAFQILPDVNFYVGTLLPNVSFFGGRGE